MILVVFAAPLPLPPIYKRSKPEPNTHRSPEQNDDRQWRYRHRSLMEKLRRKTGRETERSGRGKNAETEMNIMENLREIFREMFSMHDADER